MHKVCEREALLEEFASFRSAPKLIFDSSKTIFRLAVNGELSLGGLLSCCLEPATRE